LSRSIVVHEWLGLLIIVLAVASLIGTTWGIIQSAYFFECTPPPDGPRDFRCPSLMERVGWNISGLLAGGVFLAFGLWTYGKGKQGIQLISIRTTQP
jgi:hypothetical protein